MHKTNSSAYDDRIILLYNEGVSAAVIAEALEVDVAIIVERLRVLLSTEKLQPRSARHVPRTRASTKQYDGQITQLHEEGVPYRVIADRLGLGVDATCARIRRLIAAGQLLSRKRGRPVCVPWYERTDAISLRRRHVVIVHIQQRATNRTLGKALSLTKQRASQLMRDIRRNTTEEERAVICPRWLLAEEAACVAGVCHEIVRTLCRSGDIPALNRTKPGRCSTYVLSPDAVKALLEHPRVTGIRSCIECGLEFRRRVLAASQQLCSRACRKQRRVRLHMGESDASALRGWHRDLYRALRALTRTSDCKWLTMMAAARHAGISGTQLHWLAVKGLIETRLHATKRWRGRPVTIYPVHELDVVRAVYARHLKKK
jgi:hypothetical protein